MRDIPEYKKKASKNLHRAKTVHIARCSRSVPSSCRSFARVALESVIIAMENASGKWPKIGFVIPSRKRRISCVAVYLDYLQR